MSAGSISLSAKNSQNSQREGRRVEPAGLRPAPREHSPTPMTLTAGAEPTRSSPWPVLTWKVDEEGTAIPGDRSVKEEGGKANRETARARDTLPVGSAHSVCKHGSTRPLSVR